jgi:hypothetical protein
MIPEDQLSWADVLSVHYYDDAMTDPEAGGL